MNQTLISKLAPFLAFAISIALISWNLSGRQKLLILDYPSARSLHHMPIPRTGGLAILLAALPVAQLAFAFHFPILFCTLLLIIVSFVDDWRGFGIHWRFLAHICAAVIVTLCTAENLQYYYLVLVPVCIVWATNLYNFMDGADGLAGGMTCIGFGAYATHAFLFGSQGIAVLSICIAASALAFLCYNFHPARIFLGDAGSIPLGFLAGAIGVLGCREGIWSAWFPILVFSPFVVDASVTLAKRVLRGEKFWEPHRAHYYQRLILMGWSHRKTALVEYALMLAVGITALWSAGQSGSEQAICISVWIGIYFIFAVAIDRKWRLRSNPI